MKSKVFLVPVLVGLAIFGHSSPSLAGSSSEPPADLLEKMQNAGWRPMAPGVLQRGLGNNKVETLGFGAEGLRFKLQEMKKHLTFLRGEYARHPSRNLRQAIRAHRAELLRTEAALETTKAAGEMESVNEKASLWIDCTEYGVQVDAFHLTGESPGVGATTNAYFYGNCGPVGEVYAHAYGRATGDDDVIRTATKSDPTTGSDEGRSGGNVTASASITVNGVKDCYSYSFATVTSYDLEVTYSQSVSNWACPNPLSVSISPVYELSPTCSPTWSASVTGGNAPFSYAWYHNDNYVSSGPSYSYSTTCPDDSPRLPEVMNIRVTVTDSSVPNQSASTLWTNDPEPPTGNM